MRELLTAEAVFAAAFVLFALYRANNPDISATEKPMDFALINGILRSSHFPPADPWLSGFSINYYYFGYSLAAALTSLSGAAPEVGFNLALTTFFALAFTAAFSAGFDLISLIAGAGRRAALGVGALTAILTMVAGNLYAFHFYFGQGLRGQDFWRGIGWNASRVVQIAAEGDAYRDYTINEFPAFSFILGDLHPHVMALPFTIVAVSLAFVWLLSWSRPSKNVREQWVLTLLSGWFLGSLYPLNAWDFPSFFALAVLAGLVAQQRFAEPREKARYAGHVAVAALVGIVAYLPFLATFQPFGTGLGIVSVRSETGPFLTVYGLFGLAALALAAVVLGAGGQRERWGLLGGGVAAFLLWVVNASFSVLLLCLLAAVAMVALIRKRTFGPERAAAPLLLIAGFGLAAAPELFFLRDFFGPPYQRMNTVFKLYYQAWPVLAIASGPSLYWVFQELFRRSDVRRLRWGLLLGVITAFLAFIALTYPVVAGNARVAGNERATLDGLAYVRRTNRDEMAAVDWLRANAPPDSILLEATGQAYTQFGRVSAWSGVPTVIGWDQHEQLWRNGRQEVDPRIRDVDAIYTTLGPAAALEILQRYGVRYVFVGDLEREKYGIQVNERFKWMLPAFDLPGRATIYRVPGK